MTLDALLRQRVRARANFMCEFCEVTETDSGSELTVDHYRPRARGGTDSFDNLLYACARCNQYKLDYWPAQPDEESLWNPRVSPRVDHFLELEDGTLRPLTSVGAFTLRRLRLNRPPLVSYRLRRQQKAKAVRMLNYYRDLLEIQERLQVQAAKLLDEQRRLLEEQRTLLQELLSGDEDER